MDTDLVHKETFLQLVLDHIPSYVFWKDRQSIYLGCNENYAKTAGLDVPDEIIGKSDYDLPWSEEESNFFRIIDKEVMDTGIPRINFEQPQTINDGSTRWLRTSKIPLHNEIGEVIGILGTYEDITERKSIELELIEKNKKLQQLNARLEMANADLEQFAYAASHDLQEPLRMIGRFAGLLDKKYKSTLDGVGTEYLKYIKEGTQRMSTLISQILSYTKLEKLEENYTETNFGDLLNEILEELEVFIKKRNAQLDISLPTQKIKCQAARIKMLFHNLIANGIKFNESETPRIVINYEEGENEWYFTVSDNGIGIDKNYHDYVFKPFKRLNNRGKFPGNGVGLSICKRIVNLHKGNIWYTNNQTGGTTFHFTISKEVMY